MIRLCMFFHIRMRSVANRTFCASSFRLTASCAVALCTSLTMGYAHLSDTIKPNAQKLATSSQQQHCDGEILAVVGTNKVITALDLEQRVKLILVTSGIPINADNIKMLREQVLKNMIDEYVQLQTAERFKVLAKDSEIDETLDFMAKEAGTTKAKMIANLTSHGVPVSSLRERIKAQLSWLNFVRAAYGHNIDVTDQEVEERMRKNKENETRDAFRVFEIFLRADGPSQMASVKQQADTLIRKLKEGADFRAIAQQFSNSPSASRGGDLGYLPASQSAGDTSTSTLIGGSGDPKAYENLQVGQVSYPVQTTHGYYIYMLADKRSGGVSAQDKLISYKRILIPLTKGYQPEEDPFLTAHLKALSMASSSGDLLKIAKERDLAIDVTTGKSLAHFPPELKAFFESIPVGGHSQPTLTPEGMVILLVTERKNAEPPKPLTQDQVKEQIENEKLSRVAAQNLNDLVRKTRVELRAKAEFPALRNDYM